MRMDGGGATLERVRSWWTRPTRLCTPFDPGGRLSLYSETTGCTRARCSSQWRGLSFRRDSTMFRRSSLMCAFALIVVSQVFAKQPEAGAKPDLSALWQDLGDADGEKAFRAMRHMAARRDETVSFLSNILPAAARTATAQHVEALMRQLDSERFAERNKAQQELVRLDWQVLGVLRKAAQGSGTLESKRRLEQLIGRIEGPPGGSKLRDHRAVELVEWIGSAAAKELLERWGKGEPESPLTQEAHKA